MTHKSVRLSVPTLTRVEGAGAMHVIVVDGEVVDGEIVLAQGFGRKHSSYSTPVNAGTQFRIGSTTKLRSRATLLLLRATICWRASPTARARS